MLIICYRSVVCTVYRAVNRANDKKRLFHTQRHDISFFRSFQFQIGVFGLGLNHLQGTSDMFMFCSVGPRDPH